MRRDQDLATPAVDVVIPAYNAARWIAEALESVVAQRDVVARPVVVDDGSTDGTCEVVARFGRRVSLIRQSHQGIAAARNVGIADGTAPYVAFLDADDIWEPDFLARQTELLSSRQELDLCLTDHYQFEDGGPVVVRSFLGQHAGFATIPRSDAGYPKAYVFDRVIGDDLVDGMFVWTSALCVRRPALEAAGAFDESMPLGEDHDLWLRLCRTGKAGVILEPLAGRRLRPASASSDVLVWLEGEMHVARKIASAPHAYPPRAIELLARQGGVCLNAAWEAEARGDARKARRYYMRAWRIQGTLSPVLLFLLAFLPAPVRRVLRTGTGWLTGTRAAADKGLR